MYMYWKKKDSIFFGILGMFVIKWKPLKSKHK